jgi:predicted enzyme related to lactoylglutathione lyase
LFLGLRTAQYNVPNVAEARDWYAKALNIKPYFDEPYYVGFDVGGFELGLIPTKKEEAGRAGSVSVYWGVPNIEAGRDHLLSIGARPVGPVEDVGHGIKKASVYDPFGNVFGIIENPHFKLP